MSIVYEYESKNDRYKYLKNFTFKVYVYKRTSSNYDDTSYLIYFTNINSESDYYYVVTTRYYNKRISKKFIRRLRYFAYFSDSINNMFIGQSFFKISNFYYTIMLEYYV